MKCPFCTKKISMSAKKCPYCTVDLEGTPEMDKAVKTEVICYLIAAGVVALIWIIY